MKNKLLIGTLFLVSLFSCKSSDRMSNPIVGTWKAIAGSKVISPAGFESRHFDREPTFLVPKEEEGELIFEFNQDGTYEWTEFNSTNPVSITSGFWTLEGDVLNLDVREQQYTHPPLSQFNVTFNDASNLDLQWTAQVLGFSDAQYEEWFSNGFLGDDGWTVDRDSLLNEAGIEMLNIITLHHEKI